MSKWISVKYTLPIRGQRVLATDGIVVGEGYCNEKNEFCRYYASSWKDVLSGNVTHWMPLPEPPNTNHQNTADPA